MNRADTYLAARLRKEQPREVTSESDGRPMKLLTQEIRARLLRNGEETARARDNCGDHGDFMPVVRLFLPDAACTWLLTELDPSDPDVAYGLCDLGLGEPELGTVRISELQKVRGRMGLPVERDLHFRAKHSIGAYARIAREGKVVSC